MLSDEYVAGFFDGEGCVNITVRGKNSNPSLRVYIINTNRTILDMIQNQYGGHIYELKRIKAEWKKSNQLVYQGGAALAFLSKIKPYIVVKIKQIELAREFWDWTHRPIEFRCYYTYCLGRSTHHIRPEVFQEDHRFKARMHILNKKGPIGA